MSNNENCTPTWPPRVGGDGWAVAGVQPALPDTEQQVLTDRVQVARVARDLQLAHDLRRCSIAKIENVEGIGLTKRHDIPAILDESHRSDRFVVLPTEPADLSQLAKRTALLLQSRDQTLGYLTRVDPASALRNRARDTQHAVVLRHRVLIQQGSGNLTRSFVGTCARWRGDELVQARLCG